MNLNVLFQLTFTFIYIILLLKFLFLEYQIDGNRTSLVVRLEIFELRAQHGGTPHQYRILESWRVNIDRTLELTPEIFELKAGHSGTRHPRGKLLLDLECVLVPFKKAVYFTESGPWLQGRTYNRAGGSLPPTLPHPPQKKRKKKKKLVYIYIYVEILNFGPNSLPIK